MGGSVNSGDSMNLGNSWNSGNTRFFAELHMHSRYSRACSKDLSIQNLEKWARIKGISLLPCTDFTHPLWMNEVNAELSDDDGDGFYTTKTGFPFIMGTEISLIYTQDGKGRRIHNVVLAPDMDTANQITEYLKTKGRVDYDGRPIFKIPCPEFVERIKEISKDTEIIPAHIWTPWFGMFGENGGFDSLKDCFQDKADQIHAIETGMSSDPAMNWRIKELDRVSITSSSDSHSYWPWRMGRECTIFDMKKPSYKELIRQLRDREFTGTVETSPNYGKYHFTGHRNCKVSMSPADAKKLNNTCPSCKSKMTVGVMERVEQLAEQDRPEGYIPKDAKPFYTLVPLSELISGFNKWPVASKKTWQVYNQLISRFSGFSTEFEILLDAPEVAIAKLTSSEFAQLVLKNRAGKVEVLPGFDGVYGVPRIFGDENYKFAAAGQGSGYDYDRETGEETLKEKNAVGGNGRRGRPRKEAPASPAKEKPQKGLGEFF